MTHGNRKPKTEEHGEQLYIRVLKHNPSKFLTVVFSILNQPLDHIKACYSDPCQNGGSCMEELDGYSCSCLEAYRGKNCQIPTCYSNPCQNGGACKEDSDGYSCSCLEAYRGKNCQIPTCYSNPCQNGGSCKEESDGYSCSCLEAYRGKNCQIPKYLRVLLFDNYTPALCFP
ncbi:fibropellin-3-like [Lytechinus variegatus]|uniref:fibropellin-3-like n=1 Tax=Lytechinus variegatus TaxID=7654 RepID=UPI001BB28043|nr:fibropellin-3-like [Lytechinus variegatus]XP_041470148.1 fibropellin-3-like [Lytechinus variegatus]